MQQWIGLLDCNNFFVSCERLFRPDLIGKPVVVLSSNDGCIVARSQEVKDMDIPMGAPYFKVKDTLETNNVTVFSGNHSLYRDISQRVFTVMASISDNMEQYSVDEAFFYYTGTEASVRSFAERIKDTVEQQVGVPVSLGIATSKTLAKIANDYAKHSSGLELLVGPVWQQRQKTYELSRVWGIGRQLSVRCRENGLHTVYDLLSADRARISTLFGVVGERLISELSGTPSSRKEREVKQSILSSRSFAQTTTSLHTLEEAVAYHVEQISFELRQLQHNCSTVSVFILPSRHSDFALQGGTAEHVFDQPTNDTSVILKAAIALVRGLYKAGVPYKKAGARIGQLFPVGVSQLALFTSTSGERGNDLQQAIDTLNQKFQHGRIHIGFLEGKRTYSARSANRSPAYTTSWQEAPVVKAQ